MNTTLKRIVTSVLTVSLVASLAIPVLADDEATSEENLGFRNGFGKPKIEKRLEKIAEEKGITVEELKQQMEDRKEEMQQKIDEKLAELAEEKDMTLDELKDIIDGLKDIREEHRAEMKANREERLEELAEEKGITVDELKEQLKDKMRDRGVRGRGHGIKVKSSEQE